MAQLQVDGGTNVKIEDPVNVTVRKVMYECVISDTSTDPATVVADYTGQNAINLVRELPYQPAEWLQATAEVMALNKAARESGA